MTTIELICHAASPTTLAGLIADLEELPPDLAAEAAPLANDLRQVLAANVGEAEAARLIENELT